MKKSFTLIETVVVIAIILATLGMFVLSQRPIQKSFALLRSAHALAQEIRKAQELAQGPKKFAGQMPKGYGIYVEASSQRIILFGDINEDNLYSSTDILIEDFSQKLEKDVQIRSPNLLNICFKPPHPITIIDGDPNKTEAQIELGRDSQTKKVKVFKSGLIYVE